MKATNHMNRTIKVSIASFIVLIASVFTPLQAATVNSNPARVNETQEAANRLEQFAAALETELRYKPEVSENIGDYEVVVAFRNLELQNSLTEDLIRYTAPSVTE